MNVLEAEVRLNIAIVGQNHVFAYRGLLASQSPLHKDELTDSALETEICGTVSKTGLPGVHRVLAEAEVCDFVFSNFIVVAICDAQVGFTIS